MADLLLALLADLLPEDLGAAQMVSVTTEAIGEVSAAMATAWAHGALTALLLAENRRAAKSLILQK